MKDKLASPFLLNPDITFLNHGSFGACPKPVFDDWHHWQRQMESEPVQFMMNKGPAQLNASKEALAKFINCNPRDLVFTTNPTYAINIIAKSLKLESGDEILASNHEYGAMDRTWNYYCRKAGARYVTQHISLPIQSRQQVIDEFWKGYTSKTKAVFLNQISSATALVFPVKEICDRAKELGLLTIIDGAHVPGHVPLDISELNVDIYTGANHKWLLTPKGNSFLYVREELQELFDPLMISWGYESPMPGPSRFHDYHEMQGTRDFTSFLTVPAALKFFSDNRWDEVSNARKDLILKHYADLCEVVGSSPICPITSEFLGQMCSIPVKTNEPMILKQILYSEFKIEIPVFVWNNQVLVRISLNGYNDENDVLTLKNALQKLTQRGIISA